MDINKILAELRQEHAQMQEAIVSLERLALGGAKRRGRPPAWMSKLKLSQPKEGSEPKRGPGRPRGTKNKRLKGGPEEEM